jgi:hypothetical protein
MQSSDSDERGDSNSSHSTNSINNSSSASSSFEDSASTQSFEDDLEYHWAVGHSYDDAEMDFALNGSNSWLLEEYESSTCSDLPELVTLVTLTSSVKQSHMYF